MSGTRYFSHAPYAARTCLWKATGALHEDLVREACAVLQQIGWQVDTDLWIGDVAVDIVAINPDTEEHVAVMFETASPSERPDDKLITENAQLTATNLRAVLWFVPAQRYGSLEDNLLPLPFQRSEHNAENTIGNVAWLLRTWFERINEVTPRNSCDVRPTASVQTIPSSPVLTTSPTPVPIPIGIAADPDWCDGRSSLGSGDYRAKRLERLAARWLKPDQVNKWLNKVHPLISYGNSPLGAAQSSASGYLEAQEALKHDLPCQDQPSLID
ncbi:MAG: hypothetical protein ACFHHU_00460 [Porticoccaceae bacterium]